MLCWEEGGPSVLDLAILHHEGIPLAPVVAKDFGGVKIQVQCLGKLPSRVRNEAYLW